MSRIPSDLRPGDSLTLDYLNGSAGAIAAGQIRSGPGSSLGVMVTNFGSFVRDVRRPEGWWLITAHLSAGSYTIVEQVEETGGAWSTGLRTRTGYESNATATVPSGSTIRVWARFSRKGWRFTYGACS